MGFLSFLLKELKEDLKKYETIVGIVLLGIIVIVVSIGALEFILSILEVFGLHYHLLGGYTSLLFRGIFLGFVLSAALDYLRQKWKKYSSIKSQTVLEAFKWKFSFPIT